MGQKSFIIDLTVEDRIRLKFYTKTGEVKNFVVQYESFVKHKWQEILRYDTMHDFLHQDICHPRQKSDKIKLDITDLNQALNYAIQDIKAKWQFYRDRYEEEIK